MRLLFVTSRLPYPPHRGDQLKVYQLLRHFSREHAITLVTFVGSRKELRFVDELRPYCAEIVPVIHRPLTGILKCFGSIPSKQPFQLAYFDSEKMRRTVSRVASSHRFDAIYVHLIRMANYVKDIGGVRKILAIEDPLSLHYERALPYWGLLARLFYRIEWRRVLEYEKGIVQHFDQCLLVSPTDKDELERRWGFRDLAISPHGVDLDYFSRQIVSNGGPPSILFSGNMGYYPNIDAVLYFWKEILPAIWRAIPNARLTIVGARPAAAVRRLAADPRITVTGPVQDIRPYFKDATVAVCPLRIGAGIQNKILEALAMGVPVVTTPLGAEGVRAEPETQILLAEDAEAFARQTIRVATDHELGRFLSENGRRFVEERYSWKTNLRTLEPVFFPSSDAVLPRR